VAPKEQRVTLTKTADGYHEAVVGDCPEGTRYFFTIGDTDRPDPASRHQPEGVHGPSEVVKRDYEWRDTKWTGLPLEDLVVYEMHVGTFTPEGTFESAITRLDELRALGITAVELLPVAQFPGGRNWGYDGVYVNAAQNTYGGPRALKRLVDACHERGMAAILDVVYNHLGPEGNYLGEYGPYFTDRYKTPWGLALNFDGPNSDHVRWYFVNNALQWVDEFHFDGLRVDAVHAIVDHTAEPFLSDLTSAVRARSKELGRTIWTIAESDLNDPRVITEKERLGLGFDTQWNDDFHHALHTLLTGESAGYYDGYGSVSALATVMKQGYLWTGQHNAFRGRRYGLTPQTTNGAQFVVCAQNHDQVGNRMLGERLTALVSSDKIRLAAAAVVLSPFIPMLFMGEEYAEKAPFQYFTSHSDKDLIEAVRKGRAAEFAEFQWQGEAPDPHDEETFERSRLDWASLQKDEHQSIHRLYRELLALRNSTPALRSLDLTKVETFADDERGVLLVQRGGEVLLGFNFSDQTQTVANPFRGSWKTAMETGVAVNGEELTLPASSFAVMTRG
jgi:maltooligosyltrehalose trehalohydrolase